MKITAAKNASLRTKNRVREHFTGVDVERIGSTRVCVALGSQESWEFRTPDGWHGWLPVAEIEVNA